MKLPAFFTPHQWCGARRPDKHQAAQGKRSNHDRHRALLRPFIDWLERHDFVPRLACEFDDLIVEYKNDPNKPNKIRKHELETLVAAIEGSPDLLPIPSPTPAPCPGVARVASG